MNEKIKKIYDSVKMYVAIGGILIFAWDYGVRFFSVPDRLDALESRVKGYIHWDSTTSVKTTIRQDSVNKAHKYYLDEDYGRLRRIEESINF